MPLEQKKKLYRERFPEILATRMCDQMDSFHVVNGTNSNGYLSLFFCKNISRTVEGGRFWSQIAELYLKENAPDVSDILAVFAQYRINS